MSGINPNPQRTPAQTPLRKALGVGRKEFPALTKVRIGTTPDGRPIWKNEPEIDEQGGSWDSESSERATTFEYKGKYYSYPTIFNRTVNGKLEPYEITSEQAKAMSIGYGFVDPETGIKSKSFDTEDEAVAYAKERSKHLSDHLHKKESLKFLKNRQGNSQQFNPTKELSKRKR